MAYAEGRVYYDADSHLMETSDWLTSYADPDVRELLTPLQLGGAGQFAEEAVAVADRRRADPKAQVEAEAEAKANLMSAKGWSALGAFDRWERSRALDLLGFDRQLIFSTFAATQFQSSDPAILYGGARAHNRAMADFCSDDERMIAVGLVPLDVPDLAVPAVGEAIEMGCGAILVPSAPPKAHSPTHPDLDGVWDQLQDANVPFMLHVGGGGRPLRPAFHQNGRLQPSDFLGGGENVRSKDYMVLHNPPETFLSVMVLDGVLEQFPRLRGGCIEQGGMWAVPWIRRLDLCQDMFKKTEPVVAGLPLRASDYVRRQLRFTPFPTEPVGWMIENAGVELFLFSSDYPHPEGGRDPLKRFESSLVGTGEQAKERFYSGNFGDLMRMTTTGAV
ncbi:MAG TPA: amidohydrolase family protein [Acidimicrobiales bacterium]|nr:amidohydrolase family protein [Acidimicrobiales bacterium]